MWMRLRQIFVGLFIIFCALAAPVRGDLQGKLAGIVLNQDSGKPLANTEISLISTPQKTFTDPTGQFFIINVNPGFYDVQAFYLGFVPVLVKNVYISSDHTTHLQFKLSATIIELGQTITHERGRPLIEENETYRLYQMNASDLALRPLEQISDLLPYLPGVTIDPAGALHLHGGRSDEIGLLVDGISYNEPFRNRPALDFLLSEIDELSVKTGVFEAEYGQANSGILQIRRKPLPENYSGTLAFQSGDYLSLNSEVFSDEIKAFSGFSNWKIQAQFGGPVPKYFNKKLRFSLATQYWDDPGYLFGDDIYAPTGAIKSPEPAKISLNPNTQFLLNYRMEYRFNPRLTVAWHSNIQSQKWQEYNQLEAHRWSHVPEANLWNYLQASSHYLKLTQELSPRIYYTLSTGYLWHKNQIHAFEKATDDQYLWSGLRARDLNDEFYLSGTNNFRSSENTNTLNAKFDLTAQLGHRHLLRSGFEFRRHDLTVHQFFVEADREARDDNRDGILGNMGINPDSLNDEYRFQPVELACYFQDKLEWAAVVLNLGARLDYFASNGESATGWWQAGADSLHAAGKQVKVSPRVSMAYNISEKGKLFVSYGHFYQAPPYQGIYSNLNYDFYTSRYFPEMGNVDLPLQKTTAYEIGLDHRLIADAALRVNWFYRDFRNLLGRRFFTTPNGQSGVAVWDATDFGFTQGAVLQFTQKFSSSLRLDLAYTYQRVKMNNSEPWPGQQISQSDLEKRSFASVYVADWEQPHSLQIHLNWSHPKSWGVDFYGQIASGYPYTAQRVDPQKNTTEYNDSRGPVQINTTLYAFKTFPLWIGYKKTNLSLELKIYNLLDRSNEITVWPSSGRSDQPIEPLTVGMTQEWMTRPYWYAKPREILVGLRYHF
jgi:hypothetical protein